MTKTQSQNLIACYVSGKGMYASQTTWNFKTSIIELLETKNIGYDTRFAYYKHQFPELDLQTLARKICDPMEYYDKDWPNYLEKHQQDKSKDWLITEFMLALDDKFRDQAQVAVYCFDEAGFGSGVNVMRFIKQNKPVLGFFHPKPEKPYNIHNIMQLKLSFPALVTLHEYQHIDDILQITEAWLKTQLT